MPELPEVESVKRQLAPELSGRKILDVWWDPIPSVPREFVDLGLVVGRTIAGIGRRGKFMIAPLDEGLELILHLGMSGSFRFGFDDPYVRARLWLDDQRSLAFRDPRRFGRMVVVRRGDYGRIPALSTLGPEPLSDEFDPDEFALRLQRTSSPVKPFLLSQRAVAGVGNIYADEALWQARIHPGSRRVGRERAFALHGAIKNVLAAAIRREGTTFRDFQMINGEAGRNATFLVAYGRAGQPCPRCRRPLRKIVLGGRGTTYCPYCQRR
ncbi:MAG TPA: bifunctional DNA-formamidopyrimidine glycosylase/DNA-(apurinic or apyrimidinic site) lyase [Actinomycetota bacterium]|nr:bifunctional DNA-formamidopyrimidine glycosylase/DNA-(apurinic or apyrimidinic site) lyase [Actinomycetota bacterium]